MDRFTFNEYSKFEGKGKVHDKNDGRDYDVEFEFIGKVKNIDNANQTITFDLDKQEGSALWEMTIYDDDMKG